MRSSTSRFAIAQCVVALLLTSHHALAVGTRSFNLDTFDKLSGGHLKGVTISSDGKVRAGLMSADTPLPDASSALCAITLPDGSTLVGTSPAGTVFKVNGEHVTTFASTGELGVTSMARAPDGTLYAATLPGGKIFKIEAGRAELFSTLDDAEHVWALVFDRAKNALFAATGPHGRLFRIARDGSSSVYFKTDTTHIVSLTLNEATGDLYAGGSSPAVLYRVMGPGRANAVYDFGKEEVKAIASGKNGNLFVIVNEYAELPDLPRRGGNKPIAGPTNAPRPKPGKGTLYRLDANGRVDRLMHHDEFHYMALAVDENDVPYVGTGAEGRVYTANDAHIVTLIADTDQRQISIIGFAENAEKHSPTPLPAFTISSDPTVFHRTIGHGGTEATWTSKSLDAGLQARFGHITWDATGALEIATRSGNTATADFTWSDWSAPVAHGAQLTSPKGRYIQVRARWSRDPNAVLSDVVIPFVTDNLRAVVTEVHVQPKNAPKESKDAIPASGGELPKHETVLKASWKVDNADNDSLRYRVTFRREGQTIWTDMLPPNEVFTKTEYDWDTLPLPEGKYRVRVEASDEGVNPPEQVQTHSLESEIVLVDNSPPTFKDLSLVGRRLRGHVTDGLGPISRIEIAIDGRNEWRPIVSADGIFDQATESIDSDISTLVPPGEHLVTVRAFDATGNAAILNLNCH